MVFNSKLNLCTYLAQGNLYKNSNAIEQASSGFFCFVLFLQGLHSTRFCQKKKKTKQLIILTL